MPSAKPAPKETLTFFCSPSLSPVHLILSCPGWTARRLGYANRRTDLDGSAYFEAAASLKTTLSSHRQSSESTSPMWSMGLVRVCFVQTQNHNSSLITIRYKGYAHRGFGCPLSGFVLSPFLNRNSPGFLYFLSHACFEGAFSCEAFPKSQGLWSF